jgi:hypothetical protein
MQEQANKRDLQLAEQEPPENANTAQDDLLVTADGIGDWYSVINGGQSAISTVVDDSRGSFEKEPEGQANLITGTVNIFLVKVK